MAGLIASLGLAAYGQHIIDDGGTFGAGWPILSRFDEELTAIYGAPQSLAYTIPLFFVAAGLFVLSLWLLLSFDGAQAASSGDELPPQDWLDAGRRMPLAAGLALLAAGGWVYLIYQLAGGGNQASNWWLFWGSLACALFALLLVDRKRGAGVLATLRWHPLEYVLLLAIVAIFFGLMVQDLTSWKYALIGDEGVFFEYSRRIAEGNHDYNYFTFRGPYGIHPVLSSVYQGMVMRVAGVNIFGWKLSSTLAIAASLPMFYWLVRTQFGVRPAIYGTVILGSSHTLFAAAHTSYINMHAIFPTILAFALFSAGLRHRSTLLFFGSGVAAGFGFYTFYSARTAILILALAMMFVALGAWRRGELFRWTRDVPLPIATGFLMAVMPIFAVDGWFVIEVMQRQSLFRDRTFTEGLGFVVDNVPRAFMAFNFQRARHHYVTGSLLDEVSAVLAILGLAYALYRLRDPGHRFIVIWAIVAIVVTGVLHPRASTELPSRMHFAVPPMAALAGIGLDRIVAGFASLSSTRRMELALSVVAFALVVPAVLGFNIHRFWWETPSIHQISGTTVIYREATSDNCDIEGRRTVVFSGAGGFGSFSSVFLYYRLEDESPLYLPYEGPQDLYEDLIAVSRVSCILFVNPDLEVAEAVIPRYTNPAAEFGAYPFIATDISGKSKVMVLEWRGAAPETDD
ncbi:MAG: glycosyltransferase family 39 protein [Chloroflexi bacterium]|nr:glycosyltransferase family 39 protein [Chloroflexota bacterium]